MHACHLLINFIHAICLFFQVAYFLWLTLSSKFHGYRNFFNKVYWYGKIFDTNLSSKFQKKFHGYEYTISLKNCIKKICRILSSHFQRFLQEVPSSMDTNLQESASARSSKFFLFESRSKTRPILPICSDDRFAWPKPTVAQPICHMGRSMFMIDFLRPTVTSLMHH